MDAITTLLSRYSIESIVLTAIMVAVVIRFLGELIDWFLKSLRQYFNVKNDEEEFKATMIDGMRKIEERQKEQAQLSEDRDKKISNRIDSVQNSVDMLQERMQDSSRAYIVDKFHHYMEVGCIDDMGLHDLERRFMYYKSAGGDTFIDGLMTEIRELPHVSAAQLQEKQIDKFKNGGRD